MDKPIRCVPAMLAAIWLIAGCQQYVAHPLNETEHLDAWSARSPESEAVTAFAGRLARPDDGPIEMNLDDGVSMAEAEIIAMVFNADLRLARGRASVTAAVANVTGQWDDPTLGAAVLRVTESVPDRWVVTPSLTFTIPISGRLAVEKSLAGAEVRAALDEVAASEWRIRQDVRRAYIGWTGLQRRLEQTDALLRSLTTFVEATTRLVDVGEMPRTEAALFAIERAQRKHDRQRLVTDIAAAEHRLRALMGLAPEVSIEFVPMREDIRVEADDELLLRHNLMLQHARSLYDAAEHRLHLEVRRQYPDLSLGPVYESDQGQSRIGLTGGLPIPMFNANAIGIARATASRAVAETAVETQREQLLSSLAIARQRLAAIVAQQESMASVLAPMVDRQVEDARRLLELGEGSGLVLLESVVRAHETRLALLDLHRDADLTAVEIAYLIGPVPPPSHAPSSPEVAP